MGMDMNMRKADPSEYFLGDEVDAAVLWPQVNLVTQPWIR